MDEGLSSRIRNAVLEAVRRQRPQADTEAARQQMLVTTLRLAGHTVSMAPGIAVAQQNEPAVADESMPTDDIAPPDDVELLGGATSSEPPTGSDDPLIRDAVFRVDDPTRPADYGKAQLLPFIVSRPEMSAAGGSPYPQPIGSPVRYAASPSAADAVMDDGSQSLSFDGMEDMTSPAEPPGGDPPPPLPIMLDGDSGDSVPPSAPGVKLFYPSPGALSFSFPPSAGGESGDGGGDSTSPPGDAHVSPAPERNSTGSDQELSIDVTPIRGDDIQTEVMQTIVAAIDAKVEQRISDLRHEAFVSRAAWNALFPR